MVLKTNDIKRQFKSVVLELFVTYTLMEHQE